MSKKRVRSTGGVGKPRDERRPPATSSSGPTKGPKPATRGKSARGTRRGGAAAAAGVRAAGGAGKRMATDWLGLLAIAGAAALMAVSALALDPGLVGPYFVPRAALSYPIIGLLVVLCVAAVRPGARAFSLDLVDVLAMVFGTWVVLGAALSPAPSPAWFGYYNRGTGAFFWLGTVALFLVSRRLLAGRRAEQALALTAAALLVLAAAIALAQAGGADTWWGAAGVVDGRVTGTTGNPVTLAGLCLLGIWLAALALEWSGPLWLRVAAGAGAAAGGACLVMGVSRAAYLAALAAAVVLVVVWLRRRAWRRLAVLGSVALVALVGAAVYAPSGDEALSLVQRLRDWRVVGVLNASDSKRVDLWGAALSATADRPVVGLGAGAFVVADRLYRPAERKARTPWELASDPHSLPLFLLTTTGLIGLGLAGATAVVAGIAVRRRQRSRGCGSGWDAVAALAYLAAAAAFLLVSPLDKVVALPVALVVGAHLGPPGGLVWERTVPALRATVGRVVWIGALIGSAAVALLAVAAGVQYWRADAAFADAARVDAPAQYARAADLFTWEPFYSLEAGGRTWRAGLEGTDAAAVERGRALVQRGIERDPTGPLGYADLARLALAQGDPEAAAEQAERGLEWNPDHPVLQGLWGYAALLALSQLDDVALGQRLAGGLEDLPVSTPDGWYWLGEVRRAGGDAAGAAEARAKAKELAPKLSSHRYEQRLLAR